MTDGPPDRLALDPDGYHAEDVGRLADGRQFFLTTPFVPAHDVDTHTGREFIALYVFDSAGRLQSATIDDLGPRVTLDEPARLARREALLASLGPVERARIEIAPFRLEVFGVEFGFIVRSPEEPDGRWSVTVEPGDFMCFSSPWDAGDYET